MTTMFDGRRLLIRGNHEQCVSTATEQYNNLSITMLTYDGSFHSLGVLRKSVAPRSEAAATKYNANTHRANACNRLSLHLQKLFNRENAHIVFESTINRFT